LPELADDVELERGLRSRGLTLNVTEARSIAERLGREPTSVELHAFDAQWSEHCSYKSSRAHLARLPTEGPDVILGPGEDAGIVRLGEWNGETYGIVIAHESHNHPSQVVPFEGAATGVGGIVRDVLCMGARVIALADPLRFGPLDDPHSRYVAQGVVDGIAAYGNAIGVPTIAGDVSFHEGFRDNCLVNVVALGLVKESEIIHSGAPPGAAGWDIVLVGKATDRSGFGGAAFSSLALDEKDAEANKRAVQVPDPFLKNVLMRASYRAFDVIRELGLTVAFKDLGAGGIMGCTAELAASGGFGAHIDLDRCPTSQDDVPAAVIAVGETQERLAWVVPTSFTPRLLRIYNEEFSLPQIARHAQAAVIGTITAEKEYVLIHRGEEVMRVPIDFLTGGIAYDRPYRLPSEDRSGDPAGGARHAPRTAALANVPVADVLRRVLAHPDVGSRREIYERYDSVVRGTTSIPCGYADAGVIVPIAGAPLACALAVGGNPRVGLLDPGRAAELAVCEAVRNVVAVGGRPVGLTDCLNVGDPEDPGQMGEFVACVDGLARAARALSVPFVSGNVSFYNRSSNGRGIPPSPIVACVGSIADLSKTATMGLQNIGSALFFIGSRRSAAMGGSVAADIFDFEAFRREIAFMLAAHDRQLVRAAHDVSDGGLIVAVLEMAFASFETDLGVCIETREALFAEAGGFVVEAAHVNGFTALCADFAIEPLLLGRTTAEPMLTGELFGEGIALAELRELWASPLRNFYGAAPR
jgi:phosphoribosylformylglycinamidine synthase